MEKSQSIFEIPLGIPPTSVREAVTSETEILFQRDGFWWEIMVKEKFSYYKNTLFLDFQPLDNRKKKFSSNLQNSLRCICEPLA